MDIQRVFISSVMNDYAEKRNAARKSIKKLGMTPVLAEDLSPNPNPPRDVIYSELERCDAVVAIYGNRYGWTEAGDRPSPTEEEYDWARGLSIPVYAFVDCMEPGSPDKRQRIFLDKVQHWDLGLTRNEFYSLRELEQKIAQALSGSARSPRYQRFLRGLPNCGFSDGYRPTTATRLSDFDLVLHREPAVQLEPAMLLAVVNGDCYDRSAATKLMERWGNGIKEHFKTGFWRAKHASGTLVIVVEQNPFEYLQSGLRKRRGRPKTEYLVDLKAQTVQSFQESKLNKPWAADNTKAMLECALRS